jgi:hypothetical protein
MCSRIQELQIDSCTLFPGCELSSIMCVLYMAINKYVPDYDSFTYRKLSTLYNKHRKDANARIDSGLWNWIQDTGIVCDKVRKKSTATKWSIVLTPHCLRSCRPNFSHTDIVPHLAIFLTITLQLCYETVC